MSPIIINFGFIEIRWYSFLILLAFLVGMFLVKREAIKVNEDQNFIINLCFYLVIISIIGARIYYVIFEFDQYRDNLIDIFKIWNGGLAIHGGIIAGLIFSFYYCHKYGKNILKITDIIAPALILGQCIGRWGNFFNGEAFGPATTLEFLRHLHLPQFIIDGMYIRVNGVYNYFQPTFLYESLLCLIGFIIIIFIRRLKKIKIGQITGFYFIFYGVIRFFIESLRQDSLMFLNLKVAQLVSLLMIITGIILIIICMKKSKNYN